MDAQEMDSPWLLVCTYLGAHQRPWENAAYWLAPSGLLHLGFIQHPGPPACGWYNPQWTEPPLPSTINQENASRTCLQNSLTEAFLNLFPGDACLH